jgi:hypothetical protein
MTAGVAANGLRRLEEGRREPAHGQPLGRLSGNVRDAYDLTDRSPRVSWALVALDLGLA